MSLLSRLQDFSQLSAAGGVQVLQQCPMQSVAICDPICVFIFLLNANMWIDFLFCFFQMYTLVTADVYDLLVGNPDTHMLHMQNT